MTRSADDFMKLLRTATLLSHLSWALLILPFVTGCGCQPGRQQSPSAHDPALTRLLELMRDRLQLMHDVARSKWNTRKPIADPAREKLLLDGVGEKAEAAGLDGDWVKSFFAAQIEAAKIIQQADIAQWEAIDPGKFSDTPDLVVIRDKLDRITNELIAVLQQVLPVIRRLSAAEVDQQAKDVLNTIQNQNAIDVAVRPLKQFP